MRRNRRLEPEKQIDACGLFGVMDRSGKRFDGNTVIDAMKNMKVRGNGLGGGFAVYGLYPNYADQYGIHVMFEKGNEQAKKEVEEFLERNFNIVHEEEVPTNPDAPVDDPPLVWRYFVDPPRREDGKLSDDDYVVSRVMHINTQIKDAFVFSSGKDMAVFKGVGFPEDIADFFMLDEMYEGYIWTGHSRFPTNTQGWWGGAHPFCILDWTVSHNGEISSYGANRRYLEMFGYYCTLHTDTEVIAYAVDLLMRRQKLPIEVVSRIFGPPMWYLIDHMDEKKQKLYTALRQVYAPLLVNGPFTFVVAHHGEMFGLTDRIRLRPITAGEKDDLIYMSSEEAAIRAVSPELDRVWTPHGGEPIIGRLWKDEEKKKKEQVILENAFR